MITEYDRLAEGRVSADLQNLAAQTCGGLALHEEEPASAVNRYTLSLTASDLPAGDAGRIHLVTPTLERDRLLPPEQWAKRACVLAFAQSDTQT